MNKFKRNIIFIMIVIILNISLIACNNKHNWNSLDDYEITTINNIPYTNCEADFNFPDINDVSIYYLNNGNIPYIDVLTYFNLIDSVSRIDMEDITVLEDKIIIKYNPVLYQYIFFDYNLNHEKESDLSFEMIIDFSKDEVIVDSYLFFLYQSLPIINYDNDEIVINSVNIDKGNKVVIPFYEYNIKFTTQSNYDEIVYLIPFHVANLLFTNSTLYKTYYNGDQIIAGGMCIYTEDIKTSSFKATSIPSDLKEFSYNLLTLSYDYFSTVKDIKRVDSYKNYLSKYIDELLLLDNDSYYEKLSQIIYYVDDIHSDLPAYGYYALNPNENININTEWFGPFRTNYYSLFNEYKNTLLNIYGSIIDLPTVRLLNNDTIAVIHIYMFTTETYNEVLNYLEALPDTIENVVIDVSFNAGGNVNAVFKLLALMTDKQVIFKNGVAISNSLVTYTISNNIKTYNYKWFIKTSNLTYSAGNILASIAKNNDIATIIGAKSMGGASVIESILLPCGFTYTVSGNYTFYNDLTSVEFGVDVDVLMDKIWDDLEMISIINKLNAT